MKKKVFLFLGLVNEKFDMQKMHNQLDKCIRSEAFRNLI